jgi:hypothetical protein
MKIIKHLKAWKQVQRKATEVDARNRTQQNEAAPHWFLAVDTPGSNRKCAAHQGCEHVNEGVHDITLHG